MATCRLTEPLRLGRSRGTGTARRTCRVRAGRTAVSGRWWGWRQCWLWVAHSFLLSQPGWCPFFSTDSLPGDRDGAGVDRLPHILQCALRSVHFGPPRPLRWQTVGLWLCVLVDFHLLQTSSRSTFIVNTGKCSQPILSKLSRLLPGKFALGVQTDWHLYFCSCAKCWISFVRKKGFYYPL